MKDARQNNGLDKVRATLREEVGRTTLSPRQELFAQYLAQGLTQAEAYRRAGYRQKGESLYSEASKMARRPQIAARVNVLLAPGAVSVIPTREQYVAELITLRETAKAKSHFPAAIKAHELIGKVAGLFSDEGRSPDLVGTALKLSAQDQFELLTAALNRLARETGLKPVIEGQFSEAKRESAGALAAPPRTDPGNG